ncbi:hypothetical protein HYU13_02630 [Candidatus Woesearchaeota archaeon]|nr:hypothetical protein [Candidatus Woesearchaeota archaeon]
MAVLEKNAGENETSEEAFPLSKTQSELIKPEFEGIFVMSAREEAIKRAKKKGHPFEFAGSIDIGKLVAVYSSDSFCVGVDGSQVQGVYGLLVANHLPLRIKGQGIPISDRYSAVFGSDWQGDMDNGIPITEKYSLLEFPEVKRIFEVGPLPHSTILPFIGKREPRPEEQRDPKFIFNPGAYVAPKEPVVDVHYDPWYDDPAQVQIFKGSSNGPVLWEDLSAIVRLEIIGVKGHKFYFASLEPYRP